ncbi:hypothetical protein R1sor_021551 [Riccia sorocarpa]|uniref:Uncharacterized protein n=1 Tax=Riccia sorocarpa TaxID=122646 RepID=A0ABD3GKQ2_9MARC
MDAKTASEALDLLQKRGNQLDALQKKLQEMERKLNKQRVKRERSDVRVYELEEENSSLRTVLNKHLQRRAEELESDLRHSQLLESELSKLREHMKNRKRSRYKYLATRPPYEREVCNGSDTDCEVRIAIDSERPEPDALLPESPSRGRNASSHAPRFLFFAMDAKTAAAAIDFMGELATDLDALQKKLEKTERKWLCKLLKTQRKCIQQRALRERSDSRVHELEEEISSLQARFNKLQRRAKQFKNSLRFMVGQNDCLES